MANAKLLKKFAFVDPIYALKSHGYHHVPSNHESFTMWRNLEKPGTLFLYDSGEWHVVDRSRTVLSNGYNTETLIAWLTGNEKPLEHMGSK